MVITKEPRYPVGIQDFATLREGGYVYIDKTQHLRKLIDMGQPYFLSRPRRFGKSLFLSTAEAFFLGKKELFEGLAIAETETEWNTHAVLHLDLNADNYDSLDVLGKNLNDQLSRWEAIYGKNPEEGTYSTRFMGIIERAFLQTGRRVVVLIDEYDKPLLHNLHDDELLSQFRSLLTGFYTVLKDADKWLGFVLITGVTRFAQVGIFSTLNHLSNISFDEAFTDICGLTRREIEAHFAPGLEELALRYNASYDELMDKLTARYDGYRFSEFQDERIYNPFSILNALSENIMRNYWFSSGTPTFLLEMLKKNKKVNLTQLDGYRVSADSLTDDKADINNPVPMMYQSGYLTIKEYDLELNTFTLGYPNEEVIDGLFNFALPFYTTVSNTDTPFLINNFIHELRDGLVDDFLTRLRAFFADFPYELNDQTERHYQNIFYLVFKLMGLLIGVEQRSARGRADAVVKTDKYIYVFEFKLDGSAREALRQIDEKGYLIPYTADERELVKVGVNFDKETRNIGEWVKVASGLK